MQSINSDWSFALTENKADADWQKLNLPHTWNSLDPFDDEKGYYRGIGWYKKSLKIADADRKWFLHFEGVNQTAEVYVNGKLAGKHIGGYTAFNVPISDFLNADINTIEIKVDNSHDEAIVPLKGDFNFYGGIYRDVWLLSTSETHFSFSDFGDKGIFISTPKVSEREASIEVKSHITSAQNHKMLLSYKLTEPNGKDVFAEQREIVVKEGDQTIIHSLPIVNRPKLWKPEEPNLYQLDISIETETGEILDQQSIPIGFRWYRFDAKEGFFMNGKHLKLMGTNRHQDYPSKGNAVSDNRHQKDMELIKEMGSNFFRTAHYPQDPAVLRACDQLGLLVSMEIPLDHDITDSDPFYENSKQMMQEMIRQYYNHPSIIIWAYMNEMLLGRQLEKHPEIITKIADFAKVLEDLTRKEDSTRYTMIPNHGELNLYHKAGLLDIPQIVGWNLYFGWYVEELGAGAFLDDFHALVPDKPMIITEFGAGSDPRIRSFNPVRFDFSIEWQTKFHQQNLIDIMERPFVAGAAVWNLADFGSENRSDAVPKINSKGLVSFTRDPKDAYSLYQAWLLKKPFVKIGASDWNKRIGYSPQQSLQIFTNAYKVELSVNGKTANQESFNHHLGEWEVNLTEGINTLEGTAFFEDTTITDYVEINFQQVNKNWLNENAIFYNCGANFYFNDPIEKVSWLPEKAYNKDGLGYIGGEVFQPRSIGIGSSRNILLTENDPVYQTARIGGEYHFELAEGQYEVVLHWAEIDQKYDKEKERIFDVLFNDQVILKNFNLGEVANFTAFSKKVITKVEDRGLKISFEAKKGDPILNAIEIRKL